MAGLDLPRLPTALLRLVLPRTARPVVSAELAEEYVDQIVPRLGPTRARLWYWRECLALGAAFLAAALRRGRSRDADVILAARRYRRSSHGWGESRERDGFTTALRHDVRHGLRTLFKRPAFTVAALLTIAVGIGANTTIYSLLHAVLMRPLPYAEGDRLLFLCERSAEYGGSRMGISPPAYEIWRERAGSFENLAAYHADDRNLTGAGEPERLRVARFAGDLFGVLGIAPACGRFMATNDFDPDAPAVTVVSHSLWHRRWGADPDLVGRTVTLDEERYEVIGIAPEAFRFPDNADFYIPLRIQAPEGESLWDAHFLWVVGRRAEDVSLTSVQTEMATITAAIAAERPEDYEGITAGVMPLRQWLYRDIQAPLLIIYAVVCLVLLLACANTANLMLALYSTRQTELAVRSSLGARRGRLVRQLLTESLLLALGGGVLGYLIGEAGRRLLLAGVPIELPSYLSFRTDPGILIAILALVVLTGIVFGTAPALGATRADPARLLARGGTSSSGRREGRLRRTLVTAEVTLAVIVLATTGLIMQGYLSFRAIDPGYEKENLLTATIFLPSFAYPTDEEKMAFFTTLQERLQAVPDVISASVTTGLPEGHSLRGRSFTIEGRVTEPGEPADITLFWMIGSGYFRAVGTPLLQGRDFTAAEQAIGSPPVVIVNETFARQNWPGENPLGKRLHWGGVEADRPWIEVVGVVADITGLDPESSSEAGCYIPTGALPLDRMHLVTRTGGDPLAVVEPLKEILGSIDPDLPLFEIATMEELLRRDLWPIEIGTWAFVVFAAIALILAAVGIYAVISYTVSRRMREMGIRFALGAAPSDITRLVLVRIGRMTLTGVLIGSLVGIGIMFALSSLLFGLAQPTVILPLGVAALMLAIGLTAAWLPARRARGVNPVDAVREE